jgi:hypothetical protein
MQAGALGRMKRGELTKGRLSDLRSAGLIDARRGSAQRIPLLEMIDEALGGKRGRACY